MTVMTKNKDNSNTPAIVSLLSGGIAGGVEALTTYPIELAKTRVQLQQLPRSSSVKPSWNPFLIILQIQQKEGFRALYRGCSALIVGSVAKDAVRFGTFDAVKNAFKDPTTGALSPARNMLAGMTAGVVASILAVTPTERIKTAMIDDARHGKSGRFTSVLHCVKLILREDGLVGLYRGFAGTTAKQAAATGCRMGFYNIIKDWEETRGVQQGIVVNFANGAVSGTMTTLATQPFDVVKTRSQSAKVTTTREAVVGIWADGGVKAFWRGTVLRLGRTVVAGGVLFTTAEAAAKVLNPIFAPASGVTEGAIVTP